MGSKKGVPHRKWSKEDKLRIVKLHLEGHQSLNQIEKEQGVDHSLVSAWVKKYLEEGEEALAPHKGNPYAALHTSKSLSEVERQTAFLEKRSPGFCFSSQLRMSRQTASCTMGTSNISFLSFSLVVV